MKAKNTDKLERENRRLKRENLALKERVKKLERDNDRLLIRAEVAESSEEKRLGLL